MNIKTRRLIYLFFILIFAVTAPLVVFYTAGYRYNIQKGKIEQVGVLFVNTTPKDVQIFLNDNLMSKVRPLRLPSLRPNYYQVKVTKDNYFPWQKTLEVKSQASTLAFDIVLFKNNSPVILDDKNIQTFALSPKADAIALANNDGLRIKNLSDNTEKLIWPTNGAEIEKIIWNKDSKNLLIKKGGQFFILNTNGTDPVVTLNNIQNNLQKAEWGNNATIYGSTGNGLAEITFDNKQSKIIATNIKDFAFLNGTLYLTKQQNDKILVYKYSSLNIFNRLTELAWSKNLSTRFIRC
ncbi:MAG: PEGA domain-containing protein [Candidatus Magasanikbacteria bacterium]|nr:PEGA domain-containing protein [Candidatus Magasanikbacteria bacterium]